VATETIAFFCIRYTTVIIVCFDRHEYSLSYSLDEIQQSISGRQFFRLNRQFLINFHAVREVEHYFARKLLVSPTIPVKEKLLVPREKASAFLRWLENR